MSETEDQTLQRICEEVEAEMAEKRLGKHVHPTAFAQEVARRYAATLGAGVPDGWKLVPQDDDAANCADSRIPLDMIEAGHDAYQRVRHDLDNYVAGETPDWDAGMAAVAIYRAMLAKAPAPPSP